MTCSNSKDIPSVDSHTVINGELALIHALKVFCKLWPNYVLNHGMDMKAGTNRTVFLANALKYTHDAVPIETCYLTFVLCYYTRAT